MEGRMRNLGRLVAMLLLTVSVGLASQGTPAAPGWRVELRSSGGIAGRGVGGVAVQSDGAVAVIRQAATRGQGRESTCTVRVPERITRVAGALAAARPETWRERYPAPGSPGCCDGYQWDLDVIRTTGGESPVRQRTSWTSDGKASVPADLEQLRAALVELWDTVKTSCADGVVDR
jgi:hypothetical protein